MGINQKTQYKSIPIDGGYAINQTPTSVTSRSIDNGYYVQGLYYSDKSTLVAMVNATNLSKNSLFSSINKSLSEARTSTISTSYPAKK